jgi:stage III sporulation protein AH
MKNEKLEKIKKLLTSQVGKSVIVASAALLIGLAVYLNYVWFYNPDGSLGYGDNNMQDNFDDSQNADSGRLEDYFTATALDRQEARDEAIDVLTLVSSSEDADEETKAEAQAKISKIALDIQNEANIEALVKAKGFEDCVAVIGEDSVSVIVKAETLQAKDTAQIFAIVYETTGVEPKNVSIINK